MNDSLLQRQFLALIRMALGQAPDDVLTKHAVDWKAIYKMAKNQSMIGIVFCGIEQLVNQNKSAILGPPMGNGSFPVPLFMDWRGQLEKLKTRNSVVDDATRKVVADFEAMGCRTAILKGQANSFLYENDLRKGRMPGDIDIWAVMDGMTLNASRKVLAKMAIEKVPDAYVQPHHVDYEAKDGIPVELHFTPSPVFNPFYNRRVQKYFESVIANDYDRFPVVDGYRRLPLDTDFIFQLLHLRRHLIAEGVGMKQVLDLYMTMLAYRAALNAEGIEQPKAIERCESCIEQMDEAISRFGLRSFAACMMWVLGECLGLKEEDMICKPDAKRGRFVLDEIFKGGNFGRYNKEKGDDGNTKLSHLLYYTRLSWRCFRYFPGESFWNPFYRIGVGLWQKRLKV